MTVVGLTEPMGPILRHSGLTMRPAERPSAQLGSKAHRERPQAFPTRTRMVAGTTSCQQATIDRRLMWRAEVALSVAGFERRRYAHTRAPGSSLDGVWAMIIKLILSLIALSCAVSLAFTAQAKGQD